LRKRALFGLRIALFFTVACLSRTPAAETAEARANSLGMKLVLIPAGEFTMGTPRAEVEAIMRAVNYEWYRDSAPSETPPRRVKISRPFLMAAHEVTLNQFAVFAGRAEYRTDAERDGQGAAGRLNGKWIEQAPQFNWRAMGYERDGDEPVVNVSWNDALAFCEWLSKTEKAKYRLPSEAEWEYACRAGSTNAFYWGADAARKFEFAWTGGNSGGQPHPVGALLPNAWGLHDTLGNAYEYCADSWSTNILAALGKPSGEILTNPLVANSSELIVVRSTSWGTNPIHCRSAFRGSAPKNHRNQRDGFRVVREVE